MIRWLATPMGRRAVLLAAPVAWLVMGWHRRWTNEDAFIVFRVVRHLQAGNGPVFNAGERVEVVTSTIWGYLLFALDSVLPVIPIEWISVLVGLALSVAGLWLAQRACLRWLGSQGAVVPLGGLVVVALPPFWDFATSGLETGLCFGWLGLCADRVARQLVAWDAGARRRIEAPVAFLLGLGPLVRPDLALTSLVLLGGLVVVGRLRRPNVLRAAFHAAWLPAIYQVFRMGYYGLLVPNTSLSKEGSRLDLGQGFAYLADLIGTYWVVLPLLAVTWVGVDGWRRAAPESLARWCPALVAAGGLAHGAGIVAIGGDYMHGRMLLPSLFALSTSIAIVPVPERRGLSGPPVHVARAFAAPLFVVVWAVVVAVGVRWDEADRFSDDGITEPRPVDIIYAGVANPVTIDDHKVPVILGRPATMEGIFADGHQLVWDGFFGEARSLPGTPDRYVLGIGAVGRWAYVLPLDVHVVDTGALADPIAAHTFEDRSKAPGHRKHLPDMWIVARFAPIEQFDDATGIGTDPSSGEVRAAVDQRMLALEAMHCEPLRDKLASVHDPLTVGRFLDNVLGAPGRSSMRFSNDPVVAHQELC